MPAAQTELRTKRKFSTSKAAHC